MIIMIINDHHYDDDDDDHHHHHHHHHLKPLPHHKDSTLECHGFTVPQIAFRTVQGHGTQILQLWTWQALLGARDMENLYGTIVENGDFMVL